MVLPHWTGEHRFCDCLYNMKTRLSAGHRWSSHWTITASKLFLRFQFKIDWTPKSPGISTTVRTRRTTLWLAILCIHCSYHITSWNTFSWQSQFIYSVSSSDIWHWGKLSILRWVPVFGFLSIAAFAWRSFPLSLEFPYMGVFTFRTSSQLLAMCVANIVIFSGIYVIMESPSSFLLVQTARIKKSTIFIYSLLSFITFSLYLDEIFRLLPAKQGDLEVNGHRCWLSQCGGKPRWSRCKSSFDCANWYLAGLNLACVLQVRSFKTNWFLFMKNWNINDKIQLTTPVFFSKI